MSGGGGGHNRLYLEYDPNAVRPTPVALPDPAGRSYARSDPKSALVVRIEGGTREGYIDTFGAAPGTTSTKSNVSQSSSDVLLLASSSTRTALTIYNDSTDNLHISYGTTAASLTSFTTRLRPRETWTELTTFQGEVRGIWDAAGAGAARVTEETE